MTSQVLSLGLGLVGHGIDSITARYSCKNIRDNVSVKHKWKSIRNLSNGIIFNDIKWSQTRTSRPRHFLKSKTQSYYCTLIHSIWNGAMFGDLDWPLKASRGLRVNIISATNNRQILTDVYMPAFWQGCSPRGICLGSRRPRGSFFLAGSASPRPHTVLPRSWLGLEGSALPRLGSNQLT